MTHVCMVYTWDHTRHAIIGREIGTMTAAGHLVTVYDHAGGRCSQYEASVRRETKPPLLLRAWRKGLHLLAGTLARSCRPDPGWGWADRALLSIQALRTVPLLLAAPADCLEAHDLAALHSAAVAARRRRLPLLYHAHEMEPDMSPEGSPRNLALRRLQDRLLPQVDRLIVPNPFRADVYRSEHALKAEPVVVRNCPPLAPPPRTDRLRRELCLPEGALIVLYQGTLMAGRGLEELICAAQHLLGRAVLVLMGHATPYRDRVLIPLRHELGLHDRVFFAPGVPPDQVLAYAASADLGIVIYKDVNRNNRLCAPSKMYEYVMAGIPFVGSGRPEIRWFLDQFPAGLTFASETPESIAGAVNDMLARIESEPGTLAEILERAQRRFHWESEAQALLALFEEACRGHEPQPLPAGRGAP